MEVIIGSRGKIIPLFPENRTEVISAETATPTQDGEPSRVLLFEIERGLKQLYTDSIERRQRKTVMIAHTRSITQNLSGNRQGDFRDNTGEPSLRLLNPAPALWIVPHPIHPEQS